MVEDLQFLKDLDTSDINIMGPEMIELAHDTIYVYKEKKTKEDLLHLVELFLGDMKKVLKLETNNVAFLPIYRPDFDLAFLPTAMGNAIVNFGYIDVFPTHDINLLYSILFYAFGYYVGIITYNQRKQYLNHMANILFGMILKLFGRSHSLLSLDDWKFEAIRYFFALYVYGRIGKEKDLTKYIGGKVIRDMGLKHFKQYQGIKIRDEEFNTIDGVLNILKRYNILNLNKHVFAYRVYNTMGNHGVIMYDNWYRFCAFIFATVYPNKIFSPFVKTFNKTSYERMIAFIRSKASNIEEFDAHFITRGEF